MPAAEFEHLNEQIAELKQENRDLVNQIIAQKDAIGRIIADLKGENMEAYCLFIASFYRHWPIE